MDTKAGQEREAKMLRATQMTREARMRREALEKQIAQLLAESRTTCWDLPEIWAGVQRKLVVVSASDKM